MVSMHVVHQASEPTALFVANLTDAELLVILRYFPLGDLAHLPSLRRLVSLNPRPSSLPWLRLTAGTMYNISKRSPTLNGLTSRSSFRCPASWYCWGPPWWPAGYHREYPGSPVYREDNSHAPEEQSLQETVCSSQDIWLTPPWRMAGWSEQGTVTVLTVLLRLTNLHCGAVSQSEVGVANTGGSPGKSWSYYSLQHLDVAVVTLLSTQIASSLLIWDFLKVELPRSSKDSENVFAGVDVYHHVKAPVRLLQHEQVEAVPRDNPPFPVIFSVLLTSQLWKLIIKLHPIIKESESRFENQYWYPQHSQRCMHYYC